MKCVGVWAQYQIFYLLATTRITNSANLFTNRRFVLNIVGGDLAYTHTLKEVQYPHPQTLKGAQRVG